MSPSIYAPTLILDNLYIGFRFKFWLYILRIYVYVDLEMKFMDGGF